MELKRRIDIFSADGSWYAWSEMRSAALRAGVAYKAAPPTTSHAERPIELSDGLEVLGEVEATASKMDISRRSRFLNSLKRITQRPLGFDLLDGVAVARSYVVLGGSPGDLSRWALELRRLRDTSGWFHDPMTGSADLEASLWGLRISQISRQPLGRPSSRLVETSQPEIPETPFLHYLIDRLGGHVRWRPSAGANQPITPVTGGMMFDAQLLSRTSLMRQAQAAKPDGPQAAEWLAELRLRHLPCPSTNWCQSVNASATRRLARVAPKARLLSDAWVDAIASANRVESLPHRKLWLQLHEDSRGCSAAPTLYRPVSALDVCDLRATYYAVAFSILVEGKTPK